MEEQKNNIPRGKPDSGSGIQGSGLKESHFSELPKQSTVRDVVEIMVA